MLATGSFQKVRLNADVLPQFAYDNLGWTDCRRRTGYRAAHSSRAENPIIITPSYELHHSRSYPSVFDLPPTLNDAAIDFHIFRVFGNHWITDFAVQPGLYAGQHSLRFERSPALHRPGSLAIYAPTIDVEVCTRRDICSTAVGQKSSRLPASSTNPTTTPSTSSSFRRRASRGDCLGRTSPGRTNDGCTFRSNTPTRLGRLSKPTATQTCLRTAIIG